MESNSAYDDGCNCRAMSNLPITANPFLTGSENWENWNYGWWDTDGQEKGCQTTKANNHEQRI